MKTGFSYSYRCCGLFYDGHFVDEVAGAGVLVDDEEYVADVHVDAFLQFGFKGDVAAHGFPVAVEGETDELAFAVDDGTAAVATGDVVVGGEVDPETAVFVAVPSVVGSGVEFFEALGHKELKIVGVFFLHYALKGGVVLVADGVAGLVVAHGSVTQTHGKVGVGVKHFIGLHFHESRNKQARGVIDLLLGFAIHPQELVVLLADGASGLVGGILAQFFETGLSQEGFEGGLAGEEGFFKQFFSILLVVALVFLVYFCVKVGPKPIFDVLGVAGQHGGEDLLVGGGAVVFKEDFAGAAQLADGRVDGGLMTGFEGVFEDFGAAGKAVDFCAVDQGFTQVVAGFVLGRTRGVGFLNGGQYFPVAFLVGGTAFCPLGKACFEFPFLAEYIEGFEAAVHADAVLPIVGAA